MSLNSDRKVKSIEIRYKLVGQGVVNYDENSQKHVRNQVKGVQYNNNDNVSYGKKEFYYDEEGNYRQRVKISSNCLRHYATIKQVPVQNQSLLTNDRLYNKSIANPTMFYKGHASMDGVTKLISKSALTLTDAIQCNNAIPYLETMTRSGNKDAIKSTKAKVLENGVNSTVNEETQPKKANTENNDKKSTSLFVKETCGDIEYKAKATIDLQLLRFMPMDIQFERMGANPAYIDEYIETFKQHLPTLDVKRGEFILKTCVNFSKEFGLYFSDENVVSIVKEIFRDILSIHIKKAGAYARVSQFEYKLVYDNLSNFFNKEDGWVELKGIEDIDNLTFTPDEFYKEWEEPKVD